MLNDVEVRALGSLIEKESTTPEYYPLSLNALTNACNQTSNRQPVVHFDEAAVSRAADTLREKNLVRMVDRGDTRVRKYRHIMNETLSLDTPEMAVMYVLMVRGPQTVGEIRTRCNRVYDFKSLGDVESVLDTLIAKQPALAARLPRQTGQKEVRYAHLLSGEVSFHEPDAAQPAAQNDDRLARLEERTIELQNEVDDLRKQLDQFRKQFE